MAGNVGTMASAAISINESNDYVSNGGNGNGGVTNGETAIG